MSKANEKQPGGTHYISKSIQPWDFIAANDLGFFEGNAIKYITRHKTKNGKEDILKAIHYLEKLIEVQYTEPVTVEPPPVAYKHETDDQDTPLPVE